MVKIDNIKQLRPELLDKSDAELERLETEIRMARQHKADEAARKEIESLVSQVNAAQDTILKSLNFLYEQKVLPEGVTAAYTTAGGSFAPHLRHRHVDADRLLAIRASLDDTKPKKTRQARKPKG